MDNSPKLLSIAVALKKDDMKGDYLAMHNEFISGIPRGEKRSVMVTFGLYARPGVPVGMYASVNRKGEEPPIGKIKYTESFYSTLRANLLANGMGVFLITLEVKDVPFEHSGLYEVNVRVFPSGEIPREENEIDAIKSFFYALTSKENQNATNS